MFATPFYFSLIRKYVILVGTLFNNIKISKTDADGNTISLVKVPITYAPKDKMLARVVQDPNIDRQTATIPLPAISFEMGKMTYDGSRKLNTIGRISVKDADNPSTHPIGGAQSDSKYRHRRCRADGYRNFRRQPCRSAGP